MHVLKEHWKSLRLSMQIACLPVTLYSGKSDERWELELLWASGNEEIETQSGGSGGISETFPDVVRGPHQPRVIVLAYGQTGLNPMPKGLD